MTQYKVPTGGQLTAWVAKLNKTAKDKRDLFWCGVGVGPLRVESVKLDGLEIIEVVFTDKAYGAARDLISRQQARTFFQSGKWDDTMCPAWIGGEA